MDARFIALLTFAFLNFKEGKAQNGFEQNDFQKTLKVFDANGRPFVNPGIEITGSPFFRDEWKSGTVRLADNTIFQNLQVRLNLVSLEVHYLNQDREERTLIPGLVKEITIIDSTGNQKIQYNFKSGFSPVDNQDQQNFYLILAEGKLNLLECLRKKIRERKDDMSGEVKKEIIGYDDYYFLKDKKMTFIRLNKSFLLDALQDHRAAIEEYVKSNRLSYKSPSDLPQIIRRYNSLQ